MQKRQQEKDSSTAQSVMATILQSIPKEAQVSKIDYEGPRIALYTKSPSFLMENNQIVSDLVNVITDSVTKITVKPLTENRHLQVEILLVLGFH